MTDAGYRFVSWLHRGAATQVTVADNDAGAAHASVQVSVEFNNGAQVATTSLDLVGPGDITAFDPRAIARVWPPVDTLNAESNYFPLVELAQPDLPWRYTPRKSDAQGRLRPWCALLVLADAEMHYDGPRPGRSLGAISVAAGTPMPDIAQSWAWVHVQVSGDDGMPIETVITTAPERCLARLLCPRRLHSNTTYWACLVPTFDIGRLAGLRLPLGTSGDSLDPAWTTTAGVLARDVTLPVYYRWRFGTGPDGDFESLVRKLVPAVLPKTAGLRPLDVSAPGGQLPIASANGGALMLGGALIAPDATLGDTVSDSFVTSLTDLIAIAPDAIVHGGPSVIVPPLYGTWHAQKARLARDAEPHWFNDLNADPRLRVPAALGAAVVQAQQEILMAEAWQQVDGIREANAQLRSAQLARELSRRMHARNNQPKTTNHHHQHKTPIHARTTNGPVTVGRLTRQSPARSALFSPQFRRIRRARGPIGRRQLRIDVPDGLVISNVNAGKYDGVLVATPPVGAHLITHEWVSTQQTTWKWPLPAKAILTAPQRWGSIAWDPVFGVQPKVPLARMREPASITSFRTAALAFASRKVALAAGETYRRLALPTLHTTMTAATDPATTIPAGFRQRLAGVLKFVWNPPDPIDPALAYPVFPLPMYAPLAALSQDWMMPGLSDVGANTATVAVTNDAFIEAYMVGLNHEMARELLWNDYPTDQRGSYFRQFWDPSGSVARPTPETSKDITPLNTWEPASLLGSHSPKPTPPTVDGKYVVLVVRSEVLRRYPQTVVYAQRAAFANGVYTLDTQQQVPTFAGRLDPDVAFYGFALAKADARGDGTTANPGWFFVFQEQPHAPRFGLHVGTADQTGTTPGTWDALAWPHLVATGHSPDEIGYIDLSTSLPMTAALELPDGRAWHLVASAPGKPFARGADHAAITQQQPVRVALHASLMLPL